MNQPDEKLTPGQAACGPKDLGQEKISAERYISYDYYEAEKEAIWRNSWLLLGRAADIPDTGDYFTFDLQVLHASIIVVRGNDDQIRAFYNCCQHRGAPLVYYEKGNCRSLTCSFHGWAYTLDGQLADVPFPEWFDDLDKSEIQLKSINIDTWGGFVFANLNPEPENTLREYLQPLPDTLGDYYEQEDWHWWAGYKGVFNTNWKTMTDVQIDGYHPNFLHARTIMGLFTEKEIDTYAFPNSPGVPGMLAGHRPSGDPNVKIVQTGVAQIAAEFGTHSPYTDTVSGGDEKYPGAMNFRDSKVWMFDDYAVFPNAVIFPQRGILWIQRSWPLGPHKCSWEFDIFGISEPQLFSEFFSQQQGIIAARDTTTQDNTTVELIQKNLRAGALDGMTLNDIEVPIRSFHKRIDEVMSKSDQNKGGSRS